MSYSVRITANAEVAIEYVIGRYENQHNWVGIKFKYLVFTIIQRISNFPKQYPEYEPPFREASLQIFPFLIVYVINKNEVLILDVFHTKQNPKKKVFKS